MFSLKQFTLRKSTDGGKTLPRDPAAQPVDWNSLAKLIVGLLLLTALKWQVAGERNVWPTDWIAAALLLFCGWNCSRAVTFGICLIALLSWSWIEFAHSDNWLELVPGQVIQFLAAIGFIWWSHRIRDLLHQAQHLARYDSLTGLSNRQALEEALEAELCRTRRCGRPFSLALFDCDHFKEINDLRGHVVGDDVLRRIGQALRQQTRRYDCVGRLGGDEFLLVLSEVDHDRAVMIVERLRTALHHFVVSEYPTVSFSLGVVSFRTADLNWEECLRKVDETMYAAKRSGQNQTQFAIVGNVDSAPA